MSTISLSAVRIAAAGALLLLLAACGNKGPLVMPQKPVPVEAQPVPEVGSPSETTPPATQEPADAVQPVDAAKKPVGDDDIPPR